MTELPCGWVEATMAELSSDSGYGTSAKCGYEESGVGVLRIPNIQRGSIDLADLKRAPKPLAINDDLLLRTGDLLVVRTNGSRDLIGRCAPVTRDLDCSFASYLIRFRMRSEVVDTRFVSWMLSSPTWRQRVEAAAASSAGQYNLSLRTLGPLPVVVPPAAEQERIVVAIEEAFSKLDAGEIGLRTVRQLLKRMRDAIFDAAVSGRLVPQDSTDTPASKLLADLGIAPIESSEDLPDGWARVAIGDLAEVISGPAFKSAQFRGPGEGTRLLRGENIEPGSLRWRDTKTWPDTLLAGNEHLLVSASDLILAMDRPIISTGLKLSAVRPTDLPALLVQRVARIRPRAENLRPFLLVAMQHGRFASHLLGGQVGTQLPHITLKGIRDYAIDVPGMEEMARIVAEVDRHMSFVEACQRSVEAGLAKSSALRRSVLKAAFEGQLVPQDPTDEPASALLERISEQRAAAPKAKSRRAGVKA